MEHSILKLRQLLETDARLRKLETAHAAAPQDKHIGKQLEAAYYRKYDYEAARRVRLTYNPYMIMVARTKVITPAHAGLVKYRIVFYLKDIGSSGRSEWVTWFYSEQTKGKSSGNYFRDFDPALSDFWARTEAGGLSSGRHSLDVLPDGHPTSMGLYRNV